ncbi:MAG: YfdX family protein [Methylovulum sp.]|nr:YfdX family protein [Methylovulum sp.]
MAEAEADDKVQKYPASVSSNPHTPKIGKLKVLAEKSQQIANEAADVLDGTEQALSALLKDDAKKATGILQGISGKLDILLAKNPNLAMIPANVSVRVEEFVGDEAKVKKILDTIDDLFEDGKIQAARELIGELVSEMDITTTSIPLTLYPSGIRNAVALANAGKTGDAADALYTLLSSVETTTEIMPLPVLRAEEFLSVASEQEHKQDLSKQAIRDQIINLTDAAKSQLKLAILLGYGSKEDYRELYQAIDEMKSAIHTAGSRTAWENIERSVMALKDKLTRLKSNGK